MDATIDERRGELLAISCEHHRAPAHQVTRHGTTVPAQDQRPGNHPAAGMSARVALDDDHSTSHAIAGAIAGIAADDHGAAPHPRGLSRQRAAEPFARRRGNLDLPSAHPGRGPGAGTAVDCEPAAAHTAAGLDAGVALDQNLALAHILPDPVEP